MTCLICGARCQCQKAPPGLCCGCHHHKVRHIKRFSFPPELRTRGVPSRTFDESLAQHIAIAEQKVLEFQ